MSILPYTLAPALYAALFDALGTLPCERMTPSGMSVRALLNRLELERERQDHERRELAEAEARRGSFPHIRASAFGELDNPRP